MARGRSASTWGPCDESARITFLYSQPISASSADSPAAAFELELRSCDNLCLILTATLPTDEAEREHDASVICCGHPLVGSCVNTSFTAAVSTSLHV